MAAGPWTPEHEQRLRDLNAAGSSLTAAARELGRDKGNVSRKAKALGLTWDVTATAKATEHRRATLAERRTAIIDRLYGRVEANLDRLEGETFRTLVPVSPGVQQLQDLNVVPPQDEKAVAQSMTSYLTSAARLEQIDASADLNAAASMLGRLGAALVEAAGEPPPPGEDA